MLVFFTTIIFGALMPVLIKFFRGFDSKAEAKQLNNYIELDSFTSANVEFTHPNFSNE